MSSLISAEQLARVDSIVDDAVSRGATVLTGARVLTHLEPVFYAPTVLTNVPKDARPYREEVFGVIRDFVWRLFHTFKGRFQLSTNT